MDQHYTITVGHDSVIAVRILGLWDAAVLRQYAIDIRGQLDRQRAAGIQARVLIDVRDQLVVSREIGEGLSDIAQMVRERAARVAILLMPSMLQKMQVRRIARVAQDEGLFLSEDSARAWLA